MSNDLLSRQVFYMLHLTLAIFLVQARDVVGTITDKWTMAHNLILLRFACVEYETNSIRASFEYDAAVIRPFRPVQPGNLSLANQCSFESNFNITLNNIYKAIIVYR